jgi:Uma2 family endonuclease
MSTILPDAPPTEWTMADVQARLAGIPLNRIRTYPSPGTATEADVLDAEVRSNRICELIDGTLVEKTVASYESALALAMGYFLHRFLETQNLGMVLGPDGLLKILPEQIRAPDVSLIRWERFSGRPSRKPPIYALAPNLAIEILSAGNTAEEMERKLHDYFAAGVQLVWYIDPQTRTARAYTAVDRWSEIGPGDSLTGGDVLPGFELSLAQLFARVEGP